MSCRVFEFLDFRAFGRFASTARAFRAVSRDKRWDKLLWKPICRRSWRRKRYDPLLLYAAEFQDLKLWRLRFAFAKSDAERTTATPRDVQSVKRWRVHDLADYRSYDVDGWPYRSDMHYVSPTFAPRPVAYVLSSNNANRKVYLQVSGLPKIRVNRHPNNWGWQLRNNHLLLESIEHRPQPKHITT